MNRSVPGARGGPSDVVLVLVLIQVAAAVLAMVGQLIVIPSPIYVPLPVALSVLLVVLAVRLAAGHRRAAVAMIVVQAAALPWFWLGLLASATRNLAGNVTLTELLTGVAVPVAVVWLCVRVLVAPPATGPLAAGPLAAARPAPVEPARSPGVTW